MIENCCVSGESTVRIIPVDEEDKDEEAPPPTGEPSETDGKENKKDEDPADDPEK